MLDITLLGTSALMPLPERALTAVMVPTREGVEPFAKLTWKSSNKKVAKVSKYGTVTPRREGTAYITVRTGNGKSARVKVRVYDPYKPTGVSLDPTGTVEIKVGESLQLNAVLTPENARTTLTWVTSNKKIASVYSSGVVYGRRPGTVAITVYTKNGKKARMYVRVVA